MANKKTAKKSPKKTVEQIIPPTPVVEETEVMPSVETLDMTSALADREVAEVAENVIVAEEEVRKGLFLDISGAAKRLMLLSNRSLRDLFPTMVWVVAQLRDLKPEAFRSEEGEKKVTVYITEESVMETIIKNALEASETREASRQDVEQELGILHVKLDWYGQNGFSETLGIDGFREEAKTIADELNRSDDDVNPASPADFRRLLLDAAALIDELEESSIDNLEGAITRLLGPEKAVPQINEIWQKAVGEKGGFWAKAQLLALRKKTIDERRGSSNGGNGKSSDKVRDARQPARHAGFLPHW